MRNIEKANWKVTMNDELKALDKNKTWDLVELPKGKRTSECKWIYVKKEDPQSKGGVRFKARLVAKGYAQKKRIDYNEVFYPVVKHSSIRILLALIAQFDI